MDMELRRYSNSEHNGRGAAWIAASSRRIEEPGIVADLLFDGLACLQSGAASEAIEPLKRCLQFAPDFAPAHLSLGVAQAMTYEVYPAIDSLENATSLEPRSFAARYLLAQLYFKLRIPKKGYEQATEALACCGSREERAALTRLLREERERERHGIARPLFNKSFSKAALWAAAGGLAAALTTMVAYLW